MDLCIDLCDFTQRNLIEITSLFKYMYVGLIINELFLSVPFILY